MSPRKTEARRRMRSWIAAAVGCLMASACATYDYDANFICDELGVGHTDIASGRPVPAPGPAGGYDQGPGDPTLRPDWMDKGYPYRQTRVIIPATVVRFTDERLPSFHGGYVVALMKESDGERNLEFCQGLSSAVPDYDADSFNEADIRPVYWLDTRRTGDVEDPMLIRRISDCERALASYDYSRAKRLIFQLGLSEKRGPILAAWRDDGQIATHFPLHNVAADDLERNVATFVQFYAHEEDIWEPGRFPTPMRDWIRNLLIDPSTYNFVSFFSLKGGKEKTSALTAPDAPRG